MPDFPMPAMQPHLQEGAIDGGLMGERYGG